MADRQALRSTSYTQPEVLNDDYTAQMFPTNTTAPHPAFHFRMDQVFPYQTGHQTLQRMPHNTLQALHAPLKPRSYPGYQQFPAFESQPAYHPNQYLHNETSTHYETSTHEGPASVANFEPSLLQAAPPETHLRPDDPSASDTRQTRSVSLISDVSSSSIYSVAEGLSRSASHGAADMATHGRRNASGQWKCAFPGCTSRASFNRGCDLRKHYGRHRKTHFCRYPDCPQAKDGGFSSKKDRARHEAKHNPDIECEWSGCDRLFSRVDNMRDHVRRIHRRETAQS